MFKFSKPKTPGFAIHKNYYLTVLAARASLPSLHQVVNPKREGDAVEGFGVPLAKSSVPEDLFLPIKRGAYAIATRDRKTMLKCLVLSKEEAGFDPDVIVASHLAEAVGAEVLARIRGTWSLIQLSFETFEASVEPSVEFLLDLAVRFAELSDGVIADSIAGRYFLPEDLRGRTGDLADDAPLHVAVHRRGDGGFWSVQTLGAQKFALPELSVHGVMDSEVAAVEAFLLALSRNRLRGEILRVGSRIGSSWTASSGSNEDTLVLTPRGTISEALSNTSI